MHEFLPQIIGFGVTQDILAHGRRSYRPEPGPAFIPVEFQGACYRFGHSMVRPSYRANLAGNNDGTPFFGMIFDPAGEGQADPVDLRGGRRAPRRFIGWQTFFNFGGNQAQHVRPEQAHRPAHLDAAVQPAAGDHRQRAAAHLAAGPQPAAAPDLGAAVRAAAGRGHGPARRWTGRSCSELAGYGLGLDANTPLWYYTLAEAELIVDGIHLGPVGGRIVGEVFIGLMQLDPRAYLKVQPSWTTDAAQPDRGHLRDDRPPAVRAGRPGQPGPVAAAGGDHGRWVMAAASVENC